jgi:hypothetical protein
MSIIFNVPAAVFSTVSPSQPSSALLTHLLTTSDRRLPRRPKATELRKPGEHRPGKPVNNVPEQVHGGPACANGEADRRQEWGCSCPGARKPHVPRFIDFDLGLTCESII